MSEFKNNTKQDLKCLIIGLNSYRQSCKDFFELIEEMYKNTINFYDEKIDSCKKEIDKFKDKDD